MVEGRVRESFGPTLDEWREQYCAKASVLLVHSFSEELAGWPDYGVFTGLFGVKAVHGCVQRLTDKSTIPLFGAWVVGDCTFLRS